MDLAKFAQLPPEQGGAFLKFTPTDNIKILRFLYTATPGVDEELGIQTRRKLFDNATKKVIWDTPEGKWTLTLRVAAYTSKTEFSIMSWDRSAVFGRDYLLPLFEAAGGRICDQVYKVTVSKAGTLDAVYNFFPLKDSESYAMPSLEEEGAEADVPVAPQAPAPVAPPAQAAPTPAPTAPQPAPAQAPVPSAKKNFWEN